MHVGIEIKNVLETDMQTKMALKKGPQISTPAVLVALQQQSLVNIARAH